MSSFLGLARPLLALAAAQARRSKWSKCKMEISFAETLSTSPSSSFVPLDEPGKVGSASKAITLAKAAFEVQNKAKTSVITVEKSVGQFCDAFVQLDSKEAWMECLKFLSSQRVNQDQTHRVATEYIEAIKNESSSVDKLEDKLRESLIPPYIKLFQKIGQFPGGVKFLVDLRAQLIEACQEASASGSSSSDALRSMNQQLRLLLAHWFTVGFLELEQVDWNSPCSLLQKVSDYEAVHPMRSWTDLKARVGAYRRCFVYTHKSMPGEPIVVLHVALTEDIPAKISSVVRSHRLVKRFSMDQTGTAPNSGKEGEDLERCKAAIFYSITSTQTGLQGIELGTFLIKQAVQRLRDEMPSLAHFSSLSPIPGFRSWLLTTLASVKRGEYTGADLLLPTETETLANVLRCDQSVLTDKLYDLLRSNRWVEDDDLIMALEQPLMRLCAKYLYCEKRRGLALDSVANFHLRNGAVMWRINWKGDFSVRGLTNSCGVMVNYKYFLDQLEANSAKYQETHFINASQSVIDLSEGCVSD